MKRNFFALLASFLIFETFGYSFSSKTRSTSVRDRRGFLQSGSVALALLGCPGLASAKKVETQSINDNIQCIKEAAETLETLLNNWDKATIDCTYADIPRDLLESKNKEQLLDKASTFALFDKSVSVVSCKKSNKIVRDYIGATGKGPLVGIEKRLLNRQVIEQVDPDNLDEYISQAELFSQSLSKATSLSYAAGSADFDSVNNFEKGKQDDSKESSNLDQTKIAIEEAMTAINVLIPMISFAS